MNAVRMQFADSAEMPFFPACVFCQRVFELDVWGRTKCCKELCHFEITLTNK